MAHRIALEVATARESGMQRLLAQVKVLVPICMILGQTTMFVADGHPSASVALSDGSPSVTNDGMYPSEVARLWGDMASLEENLISKSIERDNSEVNRTSFLSSNISLLQPAGVGIINNTSQLQHAGDDDPLIISINIANILIFVTGFCGNSLVILVILKFTRIETVTDIYILNLAFADFMFLFGLVFLILTMFIDHWVFGNIMCKLYMASTSLNQFASSLLLVVMSFDRFLAVCHPIYAQRFRRLRRAKVICLCIWIMCLILMTPIFVFARTNTYPLTNENTTCAIIWPEYKSFNCEIAFTLYSFAIGFAFPLLLIAAFYTCVIRRLRVAASGPISLGSSRRSRSRESTNRRIEHLVIGIICTYTICWLPYWISQLVVSFNTTFGKEPTKEPFQAFYPFVLIATCLSYTNSALNPILYAFLSDNFKRRCSDVFRSITSINWCGHGSSLMDAHSTVATGLCEPSEINHNNNNSSNHFNDKSHLRAESRQTVVMNESVRLVTSPNQLANILTTTADVLNTATNGNHHRTTTEGGHRATCNAKGAEDQDLKRQHIIGSKLTRLHESLSSEGDDCPSMSGSQARDKHCFTNFRGCHQVASLTNLSQARYTTASNVITPSCGGGGGNKARGSSTLVLNGTGESSGLVDGVGIESGRSRDLGISLPSEPIIGGFQGDPSPASRRSVAFSVDMIVVQQGQNNSDQIVKGDHKTTILQGQPNWKLSQQHQPQHCQEAV